MKNLLILFSIFYITTTIAMNTTKTDMTTSDFEKLRLNNQIELIFQDILDCVTETKLFKKEGNYYFIVDAVENNKPFEFLIKISEETAKNNRFSINQNLLNRLNTRRQYCFWDKNECVLNPVNEDTGIICGIYLHGECILI